MIDARPFYAFVNSDRSVIHLLCVWRLCSAVIFVRPGSHFTRSGGGGLQVNGH